MYVSLDKKISDSNNANVNFSNYITQLSDENSVKILVSDDDYNEIYCTKGNKYTLISHFKNTCAVSKEAEQVLSGERDVVIFTQDYSQFGDNYLILVGRMQNGELIFIRSANGLMAEAASASNKFLIYTFILTILIAIFLSRVIVDIFTRPLFDLIDIAKSISNFNFGTKYIPQKIYNELDDLGEHINEMSTSLERSINQLQKSNESLKHDLEVREETENMRKDFISSVSHELKTPIALIQGYAEGLQEGIMDDENSRQIYLDVIIDEANKMNRLVREMLVLNQLEAGQMKADFSDFNITEMVNGIVESNRIYIEGQSISYIFEGDDNCMVCADEVLIEQVLTNFMSNAIHYVMNENEIIVRYSYEKKNKVRISVYNSGNNIPKKDIKQIWDKFYKADKARSREYGGSGIGLSVVKAIMELMHEKFGVENLPNGVEFWFELSLSKDEKFKQNS